MKLAIKIFLLLSLLLLLNIYMPVLIDFDSAGETHICYANSFVMEQGVGNSGGTTQRFIGISSGFSGGYIHEDMTVVGAVEIRESFVMDNLKPGSSGDFYDFGDDFLSFIPEQDFKPDFIESSTALSSGSSGAPDPGIRTSEKSGNDTVVMSAFADSLPEVEEGDVEEDFMLLFSSSSDYSWWDQF